MVFKVVEKMYRVVTLPASKFPFSLRYLRMSPQCLEHLLKMVDTVIQKEDTTFENPFQPSSV